MPKSNDDFAALAAKSPEELRSELTAAREELFRLRFQAAIRQLENTSKIGEVKNRIAQISTALRQQELGLAAKA